MNLASQTRTITVLCVYVLAAQCFPVQHIHVSGRNSDLFQTNLLATKKKNSNNKDETTSSTKPARVTNSINVPIRQQIAWAKAYKRFMTSQSDIGSTRKFRQSKGPKEKEEEFTEIDYHLTKPPAVFVDGYNIIGLINVVSERGDINFEDGRDSLISDLVMLRGATGWWIEVVFDAYKSRLGGGSSDVNGITVTYTSASETADNYIERRFEELRKVGFSNMVVATDDLTLRMVAGTAGAGYISAGMVLEEIRTAYQGWELQQAEAREEERMQRPSLGDSLSPEIKAAIAENRNRQRELQETQQQQQQQQQPAFVPPRPKVELRQGVRPSASVSVGGDTARALELLYQEQNSLAAQSSGSHSLSVSSSSKSVPQIINQSSLDNSPGQTNTIGRQETGGNSSKSGKQRKKEQIRVEGKQQSFGQTKTFSVGDGLSDDVRRALEEMRREHDKELH